MELGMIQFLGSLVASLILTGIVKDPSICVSVQRRLRSRT